MSTANTPRLLHGMHAVVTGGSRGIGLAIAQALAAEGANLTLMGRDRARLTEACHALQATGATANAVEVDVADEASVTAAFTAARLALGPVDILINNAGVASSAPFAKTTFEQFQQLININLAGVWLCTQACASDLTRISDAHPSKRVVNIASTAALTGYAYVSAYCAAKHGVLGLTRALALEWATKGVTVNAVCPGYTDTDIVAEAVRNIVSKTGRSPEAARTELARGNPQAKLVTPEQVANAVLWLVRPGSDAITGQAISVSGGEVM